MSDDQSGPEGFGIPIPRELAEMLQRQHDQAHMRADANAARVDRFLSSLDADGLMALRSVLCSGDMNKSCSANWYDGQAVSILRYVHKVDPDTGDPLFEGL